VAGRHYLVDPLARLDLPEAEALIDQQRYFVLHAPRQTGKTTSLLALMQHLNSVGRHLALYVNSEAAQAAILSLRGPGWESATANPWERLSAAIGRPPSLASPRVAATSRSHSCTVEPRQASIDWRRSKMRIAAAQGHGATWLRVLPTSVGPSPPKPGTTPSIRVWSGWQWQRDETWQGRAIHLREV